MGLSQGAYIGGKLITPRITGVIEVMPKKGKAGSKIVSSALTSGITKIQYGLIAYRFETILLAGVTIE